MPLNKGRLRGANGSERDVTHGRTRPQLLGKLYVFFQYVRVSVRANWQSYRIGVGWAGLGQGCVGVSQKLAIPPQPPPLALDSDRAVPEKREGWREASASSPWHLGDPRSRGPAAHSLKPISAENRPWISSALGMRLHHPYVVHRKKTPPPPPFCIIQTHTVLHCTVPPTTPPPIPPPPCLCLDWKFPLSRLLLFPPGGRWGWGQS